jgi:CarD family transcriptional regulator
LVRLFRIQSLAFRPYDSSGCCGAYAAVSEAQMEFKVGEKVVYPNQGVGVIQKVLETRIAGQLGEFYMLKLTSNNSTVMVPTGNALHVGLRKLCTVEQLDELFKILTNDISKPESDWKSRYKENVNKMKSGSIFEVAEVLKNLYCLNLHKTLSFREKKMFDRARQLVVSEIATVQEEPDEQISEDVEKMLSEACESAKASLPS